MDKSGQKEKKNNIKRMVDSDEMHWFKLKEQHTASRVPISDNLNNILNKTPGAFELH